MGMPPTKIPFRAINSAGFFPPKNCTAFQHQPTPPSTQLPKSWAGKRAPRVPGQAASTTLTFSSNPMCFFLLLFMVFLPFQGIVTWKYVSVALLLPPSKSLGQRRRPSPNILHPASNEVKPNSLLAPTPQTPSSPLGCPKIPPSGQFYLPPASPIWADFGGLAPSKDVWTCPWVWCLQRDRGVRFQPPKGHAFTKNIYFSFLFQRNMLQNCVSLILALTPPTPWSSKQHMFFQEWDGCCSGLFPRPTNTDRKTLPGSKKMMNWTGKDAQVPILTHLCHKIN